MANTFKFFENSLAIYGNFGEIFFVFNKIVELLILFWQFKVAPPRRKFSFNIFYFFPLSQRCSLFAFDFYFFPIVRSVDQMFQKLKEAWRGPIQFSGSVCTHQPEAPGSCPSWAQHLPNVCFLNRSFLSLNCESNESKQKRGRHSSVVSSVPTILRPRVWVPSTPSTLFQFVLLKLYRENNENKQKEAGIGPFF